MQKYQPEYIEAEQIKAILKTCTPFIEEEAGRYWLDRMYSNIGPLGAVTTRADNRKGLQILIAEGLNCIEETGNLERAINIRKERIRKIELIQCAHMAEIEYDKSASAVILEKISAEDLWELDGVSAIDEEMAIALFTAWQKSLEVLPEHKPISTERRAVNLIPKAIMDIVNADLIQETEEGSHIFINQKGSLEALKRILIARGFELPQNKDIESFIWQIKDGVAKPYDPSYIRRTFPQSVRSCESV